MSAIGKSLEARMVEAAHVAREVGQIVALALMAAEGDPDRAIEFCSRASAAFPPSGEGILDSSALAAEAIRQAAETAAA